ncbi:MAG: HAMP domain-containing histidine kinase [Sedimentisphaerales bacterium]|nr:HAMP domain-containing histidine kinase [Sedimentisphaerales bacterium]
MYKRLIILSAIILAALCGLAWLGYHSIGIWAAGMEGTRLGEFAAVAEQVRQDINRKLDEFIAVEQSRPYTEYQNYYVPDNTVAGQRQMPVLRSPLAGTLGQGLAYGQFQINPSGGIITPNDEIRAVSDSDQAGDLLAQVDLNIKNVRDNLLPALSSIEASSLKMGSGVKEDTQLKEQQVYKLVQAAANEDGQKQVAQGKAPQGFRGKNFSIESFQNPDQQAQVINRSRAVVQQDYASNSLQQGVMNQTTEENAQIRVQESAKASQPQAPVVDALAVAPVRTQPEQPPRSVDSPISDAQMALSQEYADQMMQTQVETIKEEPDMVQVRIEPFVPLKVPCREGENSVFGGQIFMLRHVQIEDKHFVQGFQLNETELIKEVEESAQQFMRDGMGFELAEKANGNSAYTAILDFGFGKLILNLLETDPHRIARKISGMRTWYFSIITVVLLAVTLGLTSLWHNTQAQLRLARKKDDFISAVSHELRTPLTSIRMYAEMLEKNWVKSKDKAADYYKNMRQESERLSRLIENVLDFSRIQRGRKRYNFSLGDINKSVAGVVEMMRPYAAQNGFEIRTQFGEIGQSAFDPDAVTQIVVNLLDNAVKYARNAEDKTIIARTKTDREFTIIEVEDHGPGVPHRQRKKIFEEFYRIGAESTRETTGTGLGLALVRRFAQAHNGFVEIINARPKGAIFRVALAARA